MPATGVEWTARRPHPRERRGLQHQGRQLVGTEGSTRCCTGSRSTGSTTTSSSSRRTSQPAAAALQPRVRAGVGPADAVHRPRDGKATFDQHDARVRRHHLRHDAGDDREEGGGAQHRCPARGAPHPLALPGAEPARRVAGQLGRALVRRPVPRVAHPAELGQARFEALRPVERARRRPDERAARRRVGQGRQPEGLGAGRAAPRRRRAAAVPALADACRGRRLPGHRRGGRRGRQRPLPVGRGPRRRARRAGAPPTLRSSCTRRTPTGRRSTRRSRSGGRGRSTRAISRATCPRSGTATLGSSRRRRGSRS